MHGAFRVATRTQWAARYVLEEICATAALGCLAGSSRETRGEVRDRATHPSRRSRVASHLGILVAARLPASFPSPRPRAARGRSARGVAPPPTAPPTSAGWVWRSTQSSTSFVASSTRPAQDPVDRDVVDVADVVRGYQEARASRQLSACPSVSCFWSISALPGRRRRRERCCGGPRAPAVRLERLLELLQPPCDGGRLGPAARRPPGAAARLAAPVSSGARPRCADGAAPDLARRRFPRRPSRRRDVARTPPALAAQARTSSFSLVLLAGRRDRKLRLAERLGRLLRGAAVGARYGVGRLGAAAGATPGPVHRRRRRRRRGGTRAAAALHRKGWPWLLQGSPSAARRARGLVGSPPRRGRWRGPRERRSRMARRVVTRERTGKTRRRIPRSHRSREHQ
jgi:hypothetical protein